jgi:D-alanine-D-alanine ligase
MDKIIAVLMGGNSSEREISLASGNAILKSLKSSNINCFGFDWNGDNLNELWTKQFDKVFIALHGKGGEDGFIQNILEQKNIPYTGTNSQNSKKCLDKNTTKQICKDNNLPTSEWIFLKKDEKIPKVNLPIAVKPTTEGSSIGISKVEKSTELKNAIKNAFKYNDEIILESWITGKEYSVSIVKNEVFPVVEIITGSEFYDFEAKYKSTTTNYQTPAKLSETLTKKMQNLAKKTFEVMGMKDWGRVDFIKDKSDNFYILEVNTVPGMTNHSLVPMAAKSAGINFDDLVLDVLK